MALLKERESIEVQRILSSLAGPVKMIFFKENLNCETCEAAEQLVSELVNLSPQLSVEIHNRLINDDMATRYGIDRSPALVLEGPAGSRVRFFGLPSGFEFATLLEDLKDVAAGRASLPTAVREKLGALNQPVHIQVFVTPTCPYCHGAVRTAHKLATEFSNITADMVEAQEFPDLAQKYGVSSVPLVVINNKVRFTGAQPESVFADAILQAVA